jgi:hypothetical protein
VPAALKNYHVIDGDVVTLNAPFTGDVLFIDNGTVDVSASGQSFTLISVESGGTLSESVVGDFTLGTAASTLRLNNSVTFNGFEPGAKFTLAADVTGSGDLNFQSNGPGSELITSRLGSHTGTVRFNGTGDTVRLQGPENFNTLEMNSTGANTLSYEPTIGGQLLGNRVIFNQPGTIDHASTTDRLQGPLTLVANAPVTIKLDTVFIGTGDERRFLVGDSAGRLEGSADITVNGMLAAPAGGNATKNEFELGGTSEPAVITTDTYSGTITGNDYMDFELRHHLPNAKFVVNNNARLEMGNQIVASTKTTKIGSIQINNGGTLEVGFEQGNATIDGHHAYHLTLTSAGSRDGDLTLADGSTTRMQINGLANDQFDRITAEGNVSLNGTLDVLINPVASSGTNPIYFPISIGDKFDIITIAPTTSLGDYDNSGTVGPEDYDLWRSAFGSSVTPGDGADGNANGIVDSADYVLWRNNSGQTGSVVGSILGTFDNVTITDPLGNFSGFNFQLNYTATSLQLEVVAAGSGSSFVNGVPEPSTLLLLSLVFGLFAGSRTGSARQSTT